MLSNHRGFIRPALTGALSVLFVSIPQAGRSATMIHEVTDVADTSPGEDVWQYSYTLGDFTFAAGQGFTVFFDRALFSQLQIPPPFVNGDWDPLTIQPDIPLGSDGFYDALALRNAPSLADPFKVKFVWLGTGSPSVPPFVI